MNECGLGVQKKSADGVCGLRGIELRPNVVYGRNSHRCASRLMRLPLKLNTGGGGNARCAVASRRKQPFSALLRWFSGLLHPPAIHPRASGKHESVKNLSQIHRFKRSGFETMEQMVR